MYFFYSSFKLNMKNEMKKAKSCSALFFFFFAQMKTYCQFIHSILDCTKTCFISQFSHISCFSINTLEDLIIKKSLSELIHIERHGFFKAAAYLQPNSRSRSLCILCVVQMSKQCVWIANNQLPLQIHGLPIRMIWV